MRFDDRLATILAWEARDQDDRVRIWRQLADLLAVGADLDEALSADAVARFGETEQAVPLSDRRRMIEGLDLSRASAPFLDHLERDAAAYGVLLRTPSPLRRMTPAMLDEPYDLFPAEHEPAPPIAASQISDLLARIDAYQARREEEPVLETGFAFTIDASGALRAQDGTLFAHCAEPPQGVDGQAAGAWRTGTGFSDARLLVEDGPHAGEWRISAEPIDDIIGRTAGYRGVARAPRADETAVLQAPSAPTASAAETTRLDGAIDRLRDPLEAMVEAVVADALPPGEIRAAASEVASRGAALVAAIDALELAVAAAGDGGLDIAALLVRIDGALQPLAEARGLKVSFRVADGLPPVDADPQAVERMVARLIGAVVALGRRREQIVARLGRDRADGRMLALSVTRPGRLTGWPAQALLDPPAALGDADAPELGLGFALRLVDRLAQEAGGRLAIHDDRIVLSLPLRAETGLRRMRSL
ncbi:hypothetical protein Q4F19_10080 [Sphingomonas sp. BIUV-7]|uniref:Sensor histidine kinase n=1 Tax=Sphingomonas natans TaxID=3063330 RepID=A0ABT8Y8R1_9SPHN|nr:hypothetical protein [Sphingomonas sp. BIUV-7]MDO6414726.1 hypothetical protein [Sphingomonas sp. BIUV-7]